MLEVAKLLPLLLRCGYCARALISCPGPQAGRTALCHAIMTFERPAVMKMLLRAGADKEAADNVRVLLVAQAGREGKGSHAYFSARAAARALCDVHHDSQEGRTPLMRAVMLGKMAATRFLLEGGANRESKDAVRRACICIFINRSCPHVDAAHGACFMAWLTRRVRCVSPGVQEGRTPLMHAVMLDKLDVMRLLLEGGGVNIESKDTVRRAPGCIYFDVNL